ncbi:MAG: NAD(P)H-quinone oxidoreductase [Micrococcus sp.]|nr:NAD(P)H-quinone oxidoreductase [Micrococcus sp.]
MHGPTVGSTPLETTVAVLPARMRAVRYSGAGGAEVIECREEDLPDVGPGEVLIRVAAAGINRADVLQREGHYPPPPGASQIPGLEVAGVVVGAGDRVTGWQPGERVCALLAGGGYAEYVAVPQGQVLAVPEQVSLLQAAVFAEAACTVGANLLERAGARAGHWVLIHGGAGGVGQFAVQALRARGCRVIATAGTPETLQRCRELGAEHVLDYREFVTPEGSVAFADRVRACTQGHGVDVVLDVVGASYLSEHLAALAEEGCVVTIAVPGGATAKHVSLLTLMQRRARLTGSTLRSRSSADKAEILARAGAEFWPDVLAGRITLEVQHRFELAEAADAHREFERRGRWGRVALIMDAELVDGEHFVTPTVAGEEA